MNMSNSGNEQIIAAQALLILHGNKAQDPKPQQKWTFVIPVLKSIPLVPIPPTQLAVPANSHAVLKRKCTQHSPPSSPNKRKAEQITEHQQSK